MGWYGRGARWRPTLRLAEIALFLVPLAAFLMWRQLAARTTGLPIWLLGLMAGALGVAGATLVWFALHEGAPPGSVYVPPHVVNGRIVPGHSEPR